MESGIIDRLTRIAGKEGVLMTPEDLAVYSHDGTFVEGKPDIVVLPRTTEQTAEIVKVAAETRTPVVARGMGSGFAAGAISIAPGGMVVSFTRMNRILEIDPLNSSVHTEAGVVTATLQEEVEKWGLFYPPDPSSIRHSTIGGNIACNAGGPRCLKYGVTGNYVLGLTVVLADGRILKTGGKPIKDVTGYNLNSLFTSSEGTLGLITEALLRLVARPRHAKTALAEFASLDDAARAVNAVLTEGIVPASLEIMDRTALACIEEAMNLGLSTDVEASLIIETDGADEATVAREIESAGRACIETGARRVKLAATEEERADLWKARRTSSIALARRAPNKLGEDITVPRSAIPEVVRRIREISRKHELPVVIFGHAGDGNLHPNILFDKRVPEEWEKVERIVPEIFDAALSVGGTLSGEHGVGALKRPYFEQALGTVSVEIQRRIKKALDPFNILNPGKIFDDK
ncbi:MAG: FAD-binding protein [Acidobacteriota bacterium]|jgi:glycolate oxidase|nr:FAD-binding protein [Acidobacteriota bacterium]